MDHREISLAVVGINYENARGVGRRFELTQCRPGDPVELRLEPKNKHDKNAIAVFSERGVQLGYLTAERAPWIGGKIRGGESVIAIFQGLGETAAFIRARFDGGRPTLPPQRANPHPDPDFEPDPDPGIWGA